MLCVAWSPDAQMLATGGMDGALWLWDPKTGNPLGCCKGGCSPPCDARRPACRKGKTWHLSLVGSGPACCVPEPRALGAKGVPTSRAGLGRDDERVILFWCGCRAQQVDHRGRLGARPRAAALPPPCQRLQRCHHQGTHTLPAFPLPSCFYAAWLTPGRTACMREQRSVLHPALIRMLSSRWCAMRRLDLGPRGVLSDA